MSVCFSDLFQGGFGFGKSSREMGKGAIQLLFQRNFGIWHTSWGGAVRSAYHLNGAANHFRMLGEIAVDGDAIDSLA